MPIKNMDNRNEKYYTPEYIMELMYDKLKEYNIKPTSWLENSAGDGRMIDFLRSKTDIPILAFDIHNETERSDIQEVNYLKHTIPYEKGRVAFINPPFTKTIAFLTKSLKECDYVIALSPLSTILVLDYDYFELVDKIWFIRKVDYGALKKDTAILLLKRKLIEIV